jgi:hypothetical protein
MPARRSRGSRALNRHALEVAFAAPQVIAHRVARMALAGESPSARDRAEFDRMIGEKLVAFHESWFAMYWEAVRASQQLATSTLQAMASAWVPGASSQATRAAWQKAAADILRAGLAPIRRRTVGNAKRLRRTGAASRSRKPGIAGGIGAQSR